MENKKKENLKPNWFAWAFYLIASKVILLFKTKSIKYRVDAFKKRNKEEGCVILFNHVAMFDHYIITNICGMDRANYVATRRFLFTPINRFFFKAVKVITRDQFKADTGSIMKMKRVVQNGGTLILAPQGQLTVDGDPAYIHPSIVKLLKLLNVNVYTIRMHGTYLANPKWNPKARKFPIDVEARLTLSKADLTMKADDCYNKIVNDLDVNDRYYNEIKKIEIKGKNLAEGLEKILFICPKCGHKHTIITEGDYIKCKDCGYTVKVNKLGLFEKVTDDLVFNNEAEWRKGQIEYLAKLIDDDKYYIESKVSLYSNPTKEFSLDKVGYGRLIFNGKEMYYDGTYNDTIIHKDFDVKMLYMLPFEPNIRFNIPDEDGFYEFRPDDAKEVSEWVQSVDAINLIRTRRS